MKIGNALVNRHNAQKGLSEALATLSLHVVFKGTEVLEQVWLDGEEKKVKGFG